MTNNDDTRYFSLFNIPTPLFKFKSVQKRKIEVN